MSDCLEVENIQEMEEGILPLLQAKCDRLYRLRIGGAPSLDIRRLRMLGLASGCDIRVLKRQPGGAMVVCRGPLRIALGAAMAEKLTVEPLH